MWRFSSWGRSRSPLARLSAGHVKGHEQTVALREGALRRADVEELLDGLRGANGGTVPLTVVLDSCWAPVWSMDVGGTGLRAAQLTQLAQHQIHSLYADSGSAIAQNWTVAWRQRPQAQFALATAIPNQLLDGMRGAGVRRLHSTWDWTFTLLQRKQRKGWLALEELDRVLLARYSELGDLLSLHPALDKTEGWHALAERECWRNGWPLAWAREPVHVLSLGVSA